MRVSVVIPLFNKASSIARTIRSILAQTCTDFELIIVDDGSSDGSAEIARSFEGPQVRVLSQANAGPGAARNKGISAASGEWIAFLDADDEWLPTYLAKGLARIDSCVEPVDATVCGYIEYPENISREEMWRSRGLSEGIFRAQPSTATKDVVAVMAYMSPCTTIIRRAVLDRFGGFFEEGCRYGEDAFLLLKFLMNCAVFVSLEPLVVYHKEDSALSANLRGARPIEPFLTFPERLDPFCPAPMVPLMRRVLSARALKTACVYGYWSQPEVARSLVRRFLEWSSVSSPYFLPALLSATPIGSCAGGVVRKLKSRRRA